VTPLHEAAERGDVTELQRLLDQGANLHEPSGDGFQPIHLALLHGQEDAAKLLIARGADVASMDPEGYTPIARAAYEGQQKTLKLLLDQGAPYDERTILHEASQYSGPRDKADVVEYLISHGNDVNARDQVGETALHVATCGDYGDTVKLLLAHGANVNAIENTRGWTALHMAAVTASQLAMKALLAGGANVNAKDYEGRTPLDYAAEKAQPDIVNLLISHGAVAETAAARELLKRMTGRDGPASPSVN
jgi:ankyrin repeat protein